MSAVKSPQVTTDEACDALQAMIAAARAVVRANGELRRATERLQSAREVVDSYNRAKLVCT